MKKVFPFIALLIFSGISLRADITGLFTFPDGSGGAVQFESDGLFKGTTDFTYSTTTKRLTVPAVYVDSIVFTSDGSTQTTAGGGGGSPSIGGDVTDGVSPSILFMDANNKLAQDPTRLNYSTYVAVAGNFPNLWIGTPSIPEISATFGVHGSILGGFIASFQTGDFDVPSKVGSYLSLSGTNGSNVMGFSGATGDGSNFHPFQSIGISTDTISMNKLMIGTVARLSDSPNAAIEVAANVGDTKAIAIHDSAGSGGDPDYNYIAWEDDTQDLDLMRFGYQDAGHGVLANSDGLIISTGADSTGELFRFTRGGMIEISTHSSTLEAFGPGTIYGQGSYAYFPSNNFVSGSVGSTLSIGHTGSRGFIETYDSGATTGGTLWINQATAGTTTKIGSTNSTDVIINGVDGHINSTTLTVAGDTANLNSTTVNIPGTVYASGNVGIGTSAPATKMHMSSGTLTIDGAGNTLDVTRGTVKAASTTLNGVAYAWPSANGTNQYLKNDGSGNLSWAASSGSGDMVLASTQTSSGAKTFNSYTTFIGSVTFPTAGISLTSLAPGTLPTNVMASTVTAGVVGPQQLSATNSYVANDIITVANSGQVTFMTPIPSTSIARTDAVNTYISSQTISAALKVTGQITAGSGPNVITTAAGLLDAAKLSGTVPIANGGTNSASALSGNTIMISNGSAIIQGAAGTTTTVLHGNAAGSPTYSALSLVNDVTGTLADGSLSSNVALLNANQTASGIKTFTSSTTITAALGQKITYGLSVGSATITGLSASLPVQTDANKLLVSSAIDLSGAQVTNSLPAASLAGGSLGSTVIASSITLAAMYGSPTINTTNITGTTTNDNAATGKIGEYISSVTDSSHTSALTTATPKTIVSVSLTAGDWDVTGMIDYVTSAATISYFQTGTSSTNNTFGGQDTFMPLPYSAASVSATFGFAAPVTRYSISGTTTIYLIAQGNFSAGSETAYGTIRARRVR